MRKLLWIALAGAACSLVAIADTLLPGLVRLPHPAFILVFAGILPLLLAFLVYANKLDRQWARTVSREMPRWLKLAGSAVSGVAVLYFVFAAQAVAGAPSGPALVSAEVHESAVKRDRRLMTTPILVIYTATAAFAYTLARKEEPRNEELSAE